MYINSSNIPVYDKDDALCTQLIKEHNIAIDQIHTFQDIIVGDNEHDAIEIKIYVVKIYEYDIEFMNESLNRAVMWVVLQKKGISHEDIN